MENKMSNSEERNSKSPVDYTTYPEGFEQLARDIDAPTDDLEARKRMLIGLLNSLKD